LPRRLRRPRPPRDRLHADLPRAHDEPDLRARAPLRRGDLLRDRAREPAHRRDVMRALAATVPEEEARRLLAPRGWLTRERAVRLELVPIPHHRFRFEIGDEVLEGPWPGADEGEA